MASRTKQKEEARARRMAEEQERLERVRRQRRLRMLSGVVLGTAAVLAVIIVISSGTGGSAGLKKGGAQTQVVSQVQQLLTGIPQSGNTLGNPSARVTMTYFGDLQCPVCQAFSLNGGLPQLISGEVRAGKVKVTYRGFETATPDPQTFQTEQVAALAAGKQNHFWDYIELFYKQQGAEGSGYVTESYLTGLARQIPGLDINRWQSARSDPTLISQVQSDKLAGSATGVSGTPTVIFHGPRGTAAVSTSVPSYSDLQQADTKVA